MWSDKPTVIPGKRDLKLFLDYLASLSVDFLFIVYTNQNDWFERYKKTLGNKLEINGFIERLDLIYEMSKADFLADKRTQQAVIMSLIIIGEAATKIMDRYAAFSDHHSNVPWRSMRGMRNHIAHGYFDINLEVVWETVQTALPELLKQLSAIRATPGD